MYDAFLSNLLFDIEKENKYLTHLSNFGNNEQILISSWEEDDFTLSKKSLDTFGNTIVKPEDVVESIILKLYSPLPASIEKDSTFWITKLMSNPLIETIILNEQDDIKCPFIKGPNFDIEVDFVKGQSTGFESLDTLKMTSITNNLKDISESFSFEDSVKIYQINNSDIIKTQQNNKKHMATDFVTKNEMNQYSQLVKNKFQKLQENISKNNTKLSSLNENSENPIKYIAPLSDPHLLWFGYRRIIPVRAALHLKSPFLEIRLKMRSGRLMHIFEDLSSPS